jgi:hypothetical protein
MAKDLNDVPVVGQQLGAVADTAGRVAHGVANLRDRDNDNLTDGEEMTLRTNPTDKDTDHDGLDDGIEVKGSHTNPKRQDSDGDGRSDYDEVSSGVSYDLQGNQ